jgi:hypothetical protein
VSESDPIGSEVRRARRERRLGSGAVCVLCGFVDPAALLRVGRSTLEHHHVLGRLHAEEVTVRLCRNCHALETERMRDAGIPLQLNPQRHVIETVEAILLALATFLRSLAAALERHGSDLADLVPELDRAVPGWRDVGGRTS